MIINRAFLREVTQTAAAVALVVVGIFAVVRLVRLLSDAAAGDIPVDSVFLLLSLKTATYFDLMLPLVVYIAILMVVTRWVRDHEMTVLHACGIGQWQLLRPGLVLMAVVAAVVALFALYLTPAASRVSDRIIDEYKRVAEVSSVTPGVFSESKTGWVYYVERLGEQPNTLENVFAYGPTSKAEDVVIARKGHQYVDEETGDRFLILETGSRYEGNPGQADYTITEFETYALRIKTRPPPTGILSFKSMPTLQLLELDDIRALAEFNWRISKAVSVPVLLLMALSFSYVNVRRSQLPRVVSALALYFLYTNALGYGHALLRKGRVDPEFGIWGIHLLFAAIAAYMFMQRARSKPLLPLGGRPVFGR